MFLSKSKILYTQQLHKNHNYFMYIFSFNDLLGFFHLNSNLKPWRFEPIVQTIST